MTTRPRLLITGGNGFIGRAIVNLAQGLGHEVAILSRRPPGEARGHALRGIGGGLADPDWGAIEQFSPDVCIHCAWIATPGVYLTSLENEVLAVQSLSLARGLASRGVTKIVGLGTCLEYCSSEEPLCEASPVSKDFSPYVQAKLEVLAGLTSAVAPNFAWLRIFYAYGPGEHRDRFVSSAIRSLAGGKTLHLCRPRDRVDYIHVSDIASAALTVATMPAFGIFNVGSGQGLAVLDVATFIANLCGQLGRVTFASQADSQSRVANTQRLRNLGWRARCSFEDSLRTMCSSHVRTDFLQP